MLPEPCRAQEPPARARLPRAALGFGLLASLGLSGAGSPTCAPCHGANLEGQPDGMQRLANGRMLAPPHDGRGIPGIPPDPSLFLIPRNGISAIVPGYESDMPAFDAS